MQLTGRANSPFCNHILGLTLILWMLEQTRMATLLVWADWSSNTETNAHFALYPGLLAPVFVTCSTIMMEGLVNWWQAMTYLDVRSGTFLLYRCKVAFWSQEISQEDCRMLSDQSFYRLCLWLVVHSLTCSVFQECATPPHFQVHHCTWSVLPSTTLLLQA